MLSRRQLLGSLAALPAFSQRPAARPNFLVILADDIGAKELACYGNTRHKTPHLDRLAATGVMFKTCYATPICHPTRVEILTGQYGFHSGVLNFANRRGGPDPDSPIEDIGKNHFTFAELLKSAGYTTALAGKWQLSGEHPTLIHDCGFDEYCAWAFENYLSPEDRPKYKARERYWNPAIIRNGKFIETTTKDYGPDIFSAFLSDFITRHRARPFLAYYPMVLTHGAHAPSPDTVQSEEHKFQTGKQNYQACVEYMDKIIGRLVDTLDKLNLRRNTIILFTGDNGTAGEGKGDGTELGARVPMIANCPGRIRARGPVDELTDLSDFFPTLAGFANIPLPTARPIDGHNLAPYLEGKTDSTREWIFSYIADRRILRTRRYLLEDNSPLHYGTLYDCGASRDGSGYRDITNSTAPEAQAIRRRFDQLLAKLPAPVLPAEGHPAALKTDTGRPRKKKKR